MKSRDLLIIASLRRNARESLTKVSRIIKIPVSTIYDRIRIQESSLIKRNTVLIDFTKLGYNTRANIILKVRKRDKEDVREFLEAHKNVNNAYRINNGYDFLIEVIFRQIKQLEEFIEQIEEKFGILAKQVFYVVEDIKQEEFLSSPEGVKLGVPSK